jgi:hypothetical protein
LTAWEKKQKSLICGAALVVILDKVKKSRQTISATKIKFRKNS